MRFTIVVFIIPILFTIGLHKLKDRYGDDALNNTAKRDTVNTAAVVFDTLTNPKENLSSTLNIHYNTSAVKFDLENKLINYTGPVSIDYLRQRGVKFPIVVFLQFLKETSFCKCEYSNPNITSLCCPTANKWLGFNPHNYYGMNHPTKRSTTSLGTVSEFISSTSTALSRPRVYELYKDCKSAVYASLDNCTEDLRRYQEFHFNHDEIPINDMDYILHLKKWKYNLEDSYFEELIYLHKLYIVGDFKKYERRYNAYTDIEKETYM